RHSRFFVLLTVVFGAVTGVGIWFTIGLVHPAATSSLINTFVWGWAIEWAFFLTEIAAALVYYYGWDRLTAKQHMTVGWIYFGAAWASLIVINGILTYMLTPGSWIETRGFWDGFFNPTYWPSVVIRSLGAMALAGIYALFTAAWIASPDLKGKLSRYAAVGWILPMAIGMPIALFWYFAAAGNAGVPVAEIFGASSAGAWDLLRSAFAAAPSGYPLAQTALRVALVAITLTLAGVFALTTLRRDRFGRISTGAILAGGLLSIGAAEWVREDLRKPFVIGSYMFVSGVRAVTPDDTEDALRIDRVSTAGILATALWLRIPANASEPERGEEIFRLVCSQCHTKDDYLAIRPVVAGKNAATILRVIDSLDTWRHRRMPPFPGSDEEKRALAIYLAALGGGSPDLPPPVAAASGADLFESSCAMCHGTGSDWPMQPRVAGRSEDEIYEALGRLPELNEVMPPFEGTDAERRALAGYLATLAETR
ncbi:MAG TPA: c-type cytochrome, partial [Thermoanaerobaculia bacterium]|nr:c-type cytochrome [Thermoanaerobaculia bacterium]